MIRGRSRANACFKGVLIAIVASVGLALSTSSALASFGVEEPYFEAGTCINETCTYASVEGNPSEAFTQAGGHPQAGITAFEFNHSGSAPEGSVKTIRVDLPPGLAGNPEALPQCPVKEFEENKCSASTEVGTNELTVYDGVSDITVKGTVYNLQQAPGVPLNFGIHVAVEPLVDLHIFLEGHVHWYADSHGPADYHEYFIINNIPKEGEVLGLKVPLSVLKSKLIFKGRAGDGDFLTLPSTCSNTTTSQLEVESWEGAVSRTQTHTPAGVSGCDKVPFSPSATVKPETAQSDEVDGVSTELKVPQHPGGEEINTSDIQDVHVTLPEGMTLNPAAARNLQACTESQIAIGSSAPVSCPAASALGTVSIETDLPPNSLTGTFYLGSPSGATITKPPFTIYIDAESQYGVSVRLQGLVEPDPVTGRLQVSFKSNPQLPFSSLTLKAKGGAQAPLANPLSCGNSSTDSLFTPYTGGSAATSSTAFTTTGCASSLPFSLAQSTSASSPNAGAYSAYTLNLARTSGQQYLSQIATTLPEGVLGDIPSVPLCAEPQAGAGTCSATSQIGTATVAAGAGGEPYSFAGPVFLTGPYNGAPYGLSIAVPAKAGPFDLGSGSCDCVLARATLTVNPYTTRITATASVPTIVDGVPLRLRNLNVTVNRPNFLFNPTSCSALATESTLTSTFGATQGVANPFQVGNCPALAFKPSLIAAAASPKTKLAGANLIVNLAQPAHEANIHSVTVQLPPQLVIRQGSLKYACPEATFAANFANCPANSKVGVATVSTPVLPTPLSGHAYLVSHGGAAFPDLDLVLEGSGVRVIVVGNNNISKGITTSTFAAIPDAPVTAFDLDLESGPYSALAPNGSLCTAAPVMPTVITAQNGAQVKQSTKLAVSGCPASSRRVKIVSHRLSHNMLLVKVRTYTAGRLTASGKYLHTVSRKLKKAQTLTLKLRLSPKALASLRHHRRVKFTLHVHLTPSRKGESAGSASAALSLKRR